MRIKTRLILLFISAAVIVTATLGATFYIETSINSALESGKRAHTLVRQVSELNSLGAEINIARVSRVQAQWERKVADVRAAINDYGSQAPELAMLAELEQLDGTFRKMVGMFREDRRTGFSGRYAQARFFLWNHFAVLLQSLVTLANETANRGYERIRDMQLKRNMFLVVVAVFWIAAVVVWSMTLWNGFMRPLKGMLKAVNAVGQGELGYRIPVRRRKSEMDELIISFNGMMDRLKDLTVTRKRLIDAAEKERSRIGRELHDGICQAMAGARLQIASLPCEDVACRAGLKRISTLLQQTLVETRRIVKDLRPLMLDDLGLIATLKWLKEQNRGVAELVLHFSIDEDDIPTRLRTPIYRIVQEALNNAVQHGKCSKLYVQLAAGDGCLDLTIEDDGLGFDLSSVSVGSGMVNMRERVAAEQGDLSIDTAPGKGCCILVSFPMAVVKTA